MLRHARSAMLVAFTATSALAGALAWSPPTSAEPGGDLPEPVQDPTAIAVDQIRAVAEPLANLEDRPGFGRVTMDIGRRQVRVDWRGAPPREVTDAAARTADGIEVVVRAVRFSDAQLTAKAATLIESGRRPGGVPVAVVTKNQDLDGLVAEVPATAAGRMDQTVAASELSRSLGVPVEVRAGQEWVSQTRRNDSAPWQGGGQLRFAANGNFCTAGFAVLTSGGAGRLLTAGHCNPGAASRVNDGAGEQIAAANTSRFDGNFDSLLIDPSASPGTVGKVFGGAWNAGTTASRYQLHVGGSAAPSVGDTVCISGANSGEHCGRTITDTGVTYDCSGRVCTGFIYSGSGVTSVGGDSGAPVYAMRSDGRVSARGIHSGGLNQVTCPTSTAVDPGSNCSSRSIAVGIHQLLNRWNVTVEQD